LDHLLTDEQTTIKELVRTIADEKIVPVRAEFDETEVHDRTGCHFHSSYLPARLRWLSRSQPDVFRQVRRWLSVGEYMLLKLFGEASVSYSVASWNGLRAVSRTGILTAGTEASSSLMISRVLSWRRCLPPFISKPAGSIPWSKTRR